MEPLFFLFLLPALIGVLAELVFRDTRYASIVAMIGSAAIVCVGLRSLDPEAAWSWLATFLVLPLPIAFALAAVVILYGRSHIRRRHETHDG